MKFYLNKQLNEAEFTQKKEKIKLLINNLEYSKSYSESISNGNLLYIVPINSNYATASSLSNNYTKTFLLILDKGGKVLTANIVEYIPPVGSFNREMPTHALSKIYHSDDCDDGKYIFNNLSGKIIHSIEYEKGKIHKVENKELRSGPTIESSGSSQCYAVYLVTTIIYSDGTIVTDEVFLYYSCGLASTLENPDGGGGGLGDDNAEQAVEKEVSWRPRKDWSPDGIPQLFYIESTEKLEGVKYTNPTRDPIFTKVTHLKDELKKIRSDYKVVWYRTSLSTSYSPSVASVTIGGWLDFQDPGLPNETLIPVTNSWISKIEL